MIADYVEDVNAGGGAPNGTLDVGDSVTWLGADGLDAGPGGDDVSGLTFGSDAFTEIQSAIDATAAGDDVLVAADTYNEALNVTDTISIIGSGPGLSIVDGGGGVTTGLTVSDPAIIGLADTVSVSGLTIQNHILGGIESAATNLSIDDIVVDGGINGISVTDGSTTISDTKISGSGVFGLNVEATATATVDRSEITGVTSASGAGVFAAGAAGGGDGASVTITESIVGSNNRGLLAAAGSTVTISGSNLAGNTLAVEAAAGNVVNASANWWGSADALTIAGSVSGPVDFSPFLETGADAGAAATGFIGDFSVLNVTALGSQAGAGPRIQEAIDNAAEPTTVNVHDGTYDEVVVIDHSLTLQSETLLGASIAPTTGSQQSVISIVDAEDVTVSNLAIQVNQNDGVSGPIAPVGISAVQTDFDGLSIADNVITSIGDASANWTGSPSLSVRAAGIVLFDNAAGAVPTVTLSDNDVDVLSGTSFFQRGVWLAQVEADVTGNTLAGAANDLLFQFASAGTNGDGVSLIQDNDLWASIRGGGGGLNISGPNASSLGITVNDNDFAPVAGDPFMFQQSAIVNQNPNSVPISFTANTFTGHVVGLSIGNAAAVTVSDNEFTPTAATDVNIITAGGTFSVRGVLGGNDFVNVAFDSDAPSGSDSTTLANAASIFNNTFNASATAGCDWYGDHRLGQSGWQHLRCDRS